MFRGAGYILQSIKRARAAQIGTILLENTHFRAPEPATFARRLQLLLDHVELRRGSSYSYSEIAGFLESRGVSMSRSRWSYILTGEHWRLRDRHVLDALADLFDVNAEFFYGTGEMPPQLQADVPKLLAVRGQRVQTFAARNLQDLAPETLRSITAALERIRQHPIN